METVAASLKVFYLQDFLINCFSRDLMPVVYSYCQRHFVFHRFHD